MRLILVIVEMFYKYCDEMVVKFNFLCINIIVNICVEV